MRENYESLGAEFENKPEPEINPDSDSKKNQTEDGQEARTRHKFYFDKKTTAKVPELLSNENVEKVEKGIINRRDILKDCFTKQDFIDLGLEEQSQETIEFINKYKNQIIKFANDRGVNVEKRFPDNEDIYFLNNEAIAGMSGRPGYDSPTGICSTNEVMVNKEKAADKYGALLHELVHFACKEKFFIFNNSRSKSTCKGYALTGKNKYYKFFNEGLTETTKRQIYLENGEQALSLSYPPQVIFVTELAKDLAQKMSKKENKEVSQKDVLTHLQAGMFQSDRSYLGIIIDFYNKEAFKALMEMGKKEEDVIKVSKLFELSAVEEKINNYKDKKETKITIGDKDLLFYGDDRR